MDSGVRYNSEREKQGGGGGGGRKKKTQEIKSIKSYELYSVTLISVIMDFYENLK